MFAEWKYSRIGASDGFYEEFLSVSFMGYFKIGASGGLYKEFLRIALMKYPAGAQPPEASIISQSRWEFVLPAEPKGPGGWSPDLLS